MPRMGVPMKLFLVVSYCLILVASALGIAWRDVRYYGVTLAIAFVLLVLILSGWRG